MLEDIQTQDVMKQSRGVKASEDQDYMTAAFDARRLNCTCAAFPPTLLPLSRLSLWVHMHHLQSI